MKNIMKSFARKVTFSTAVFGLAISVISINTDYNALFNSGEITFSVINEADAGRSYTRTTTTTTTTRSTTTGSSTTRSTATRNTTSTTSVGTARNMSSTINRDFNYSSIRKNLRNASYNNVGPDVVDWTVMAAILIAANDSSGAQEVQDGNVTEEHVKQAVRYCKDIDEDDYVGRECAQISQEAKQDNTSFGIIKVLIVMVAIFLGIIMIARTLLFRN